MSTSLNFVSNPGTQLLLAASASNANWPWFERDCSEFQRKLTRPVNGCPRCRFEMVDIGRTQIIYKCFLCFPSEGGGIEDGSDPCDKIDGHIVVLIGRVNSQYRLLIELRKLTREESFRRAFL